VHAFSCAYLQENELCHNSFSEGGPYQLTRKGLHEKEKNRHITKKRFLLGWIGCDDAIRFMCVPIYYLCAGERGAFEKKEMRLVGLDKKQIYTFTYVLSFF